ncbi:MAG: hypothetical protein R2697_18570 [Ilumatobacteraceae bacterium]
MCQSYDPIAKAWEVNSYDPSAGEAAPLFPIAPAYTLIGAPAPIPGDGIDVPAIGTGETAACIIVNRASAITIEKIGDGNQADFGFTHPGVGTGSSTIAPTSAGDTELVAPGTYTITEGAAPDAGWDLTDVYCYSGGDDNVSIADGDVDLRSVTVEVGQGESVTCRFENDAGLLPADPQGRRRDLEHDVRLRHRPRRQPRRRR